MCRMWIRVNQVVTYSFDHCLFNPLCHCIFSFCKLWIFIPRSMSLFTAIQEWSHVYSWPLSQEYIIRADTTSTTRLSACTQLQKACLHVIKPMQASIMVWQQYRSTKPQPTQTPLSRMYLIIQFLAKTNTCSVKSWKVILHIFSSLGGGDSPRYQPSVKNLKLHIVWSIPNCDCGECFSTGG